MHTWFGTIRTGMNEITITHLEAGRRLDRFVRKYLPSAPLSLIYKFLRKKQIKLNRKGAKGDETLQIGDIITFYLSDETIMGFSQEKTINTCHGSLNIVYEDANILLVNKPTGLPAHSGVGGSMDNLMGRILHYLIETGSYTAADNPTFTPALCNRLDVNTSGLVTCGKTPLALRWLNGLFKGHEMEKEYWAVVQGTLKGQGTIEGYYIKNKKANKTQIIKNNGHAGHPMVITKYEMVSCNKTHTLLKIWPVTGRSHQIRAHMASIGYPLAGDVKYGGRITTYAPGQLLHCYKLTVKKNHAPDGLPYINGVSWQAEPGQGFYSCLKELFGLIEPSLS